MWPHYKLGSTGFLDKQPLLSVLPWVSSYNGSADQGAFPTAHLVDEDDGPKFQASWYRQTLI